MDLGTGLVIWTPQEREKFPDCEKEDFAGIAEAEQEVQSVAPLLDED